VGELSFDFMRQGRAQKAPPPAEEAPKRTKRSSVLKRHSRNTYRRAFSETQLLDLVEGEDFAAEQGASYHFLTGGDVDGLSYLKIILRQQSLDYCLFSTWCMAAEDIYQIRDWLEAGRIKKLDAYVGEIFPNTYRLEYALLKTVVTEDVGRIAVFRNHAKIFAGVGQKFAFGIQTSANINTNPRVENGCITIGDDIYKFYKDFFDGIVTIVKE
jgi:hypothetical protein